MDDETTEKNVKHKVLDENMIIHGNGFAELFAGIATFWLRYGAVVFTLNL
jgi:hypothetical protein